MKDRRQHGCQVPELPTRIVSFSISSVWAERDRFLGVLTAAERATWDGLRIEKRRRDWLAGRVALKRAAQRRLGLSFSVLTILPDALGKPHLHVGGRRVADTHLSLSHSEDVAVATISSEPVGIDVEAVRTRDSGFEAMFMPREDQDALRELTDTARSVRVTRAWCLKEAIAKWRGTGFHDPFSELTLPSGVRVSEGSWVEAGHTMCWAEVLGTEASLGNGRSEVEIS